MNAKNKLMTRILVWVLVALMVIGAASLTIPAIVNKVQANRAAKQQEQQEQHDEHEGHDHE